MIFTQRLRNDIDIVRTFSLNELKVKYKRSALGFAWSLLNPLFTILIISLVFSSIMGMHFNEFVLFFFPGYLAWSLFAMSVNNSAMSLVNNEGLIKKVSINKLIFPVVAVMVSFVDFLLSIGALFLLAFFIGLKPNPALLTLPFAILMLLAFTMGIAIIVSMATAFFRDIAHIVSIIMQFWFYVTPVLYPKAKLEGIPLLLDINPMVAYVEMVRHPVFQADFAPAEYYIKSAVFAVAALTIGYVFYLKYQHKIVHRI